jgi:hypothetical protein
VRRVLSVDLWARVRAAVDCRMSCHAAAAAGRGWGVECEPRRQRRRPKDDLHRPAVRRAVHRDAFTADVDQSLVPELTTGDIIVTDNPSRERGPAIR